MKEKILIRAEGLSAGYGKETDILHDLTFSLHEGERLCVIGPNGCGKTTLLRVLAGTLSYRGRLEVTIQDAASRKYGSPVERTKMSQREAARETGFLTQLSTAYFSFPVAETVMLGRYAHQKPGFSATPNMADRKAVELAMEACGILDIRGLTLSHLSGGQLQRVFLARTLAQNPATLLLDEPTNHLDLYYQLELIRRLETWIASGSHAAIGVFHDLSLTLAFADTVMLLEKGQIADYGTPRAVINGQTINRVYHMDVAASMRQLLQNW